MSVMIFTRDLRLRDNLALLKALKHSKKPVICIFVFRKKQIGKENEYRSDNSIEFMMESLDSLRKDLISKGGNLYFIYETKGNETLVKTLKSLGEDVHVFASRGITPFGGKRDSQLREDIENAGFEITFVENHLLNEKTRNIVTGSGGIYTTFQPFYRRVLENGVPFVKRLPKSSLFYSGKIPGTVTLDEVRMFLPKMRVSPCRRVVGGEKEGLRILKNAAKTLKSYKDTRDSFKESTSLLSAYHHYGCVSVRDSYHSLREIPAITRQIIFREYANHQLIRWESTGWCSPKSIGKTIKWKTDKKLESAWKHGRTGVPLVDAAMRQLRQEGYIHNRGRMVVANYLVKNMGLDWRIGEKHFAKWLTDYDWAANFMNWLQISSLLPTDMYSRGMNPYIQAKKHDPELVYIHKYVPELRSADPKQIFSQERSEPIGDYPAPLLDYKTSKKEFLDWAKIHLSGFHPRKECV